MDKKTVLIFKKTGLPEYLFSITTQSNHQYNTSLTEYVTTFYCRADIFKYSYFPSTILKWNNLDIKNKKS